MRTWQRRTIGVLTLGGSAMGVILIIAQLVNAPPPAFAIAVSLLFVALYSVGITAGALFLERDQRAYNFALPFWLLQIPVIATKQFIYDLFAGAGFTLSFNEDGIFRASPAFGSQFNFHVGESEVPFTIGANLVAIYVSFIIWKYRHQVL